MGLARRAKSTVKKVTARFSYPASVVKVLTATLLSPTQRKYTLEWLKSLRQGYLMNRPMPWIVYDAYEYLQQNVPEHVRVFEYGSGASTLYWLQVKKATCVSIEHDPVWYDLLRDKLKSSSLAAQLDYRLILPEAKPELKSNFDDPQNYSDDKYIGFSFEQYVKQIDEFPPESFDVVIVDGRSRPACIVHGISRVKPGGLLIVDNADRGWYFNHTAPLLKTLTPVSFTGLLAGYFRHTTTNIYLKPR